MIILYQDKKDCCGCTACANICPKKSISMREDTEGFKYPAVDEAICSGCGLCKKTCAFRSSDSNLNSFQEPFVYAVKHSDESIRMNSSSGGAFTAISDYILNKQGVVYGVAFDDEMNVVHQRAQTQDERNKFRESKYVQSDLSNVFQKVGSDLSSGITTLFTGTPCQCAGLKSYLQNKGIAQDKSILCDVVCHGTPSPRLWREHINFLMKKENSRIKEYHCKCKIKGWHTHTERVVFENGKEDYTSLKSQMHKIIFYSHNALRPACHGCLYANFNRQSDITIADFWNIEKTLADFDDNRGVSLVLINTTKGEEIFEQIHKNILYIPSNLKDCMQPNLLKPTEVSNNREKFWNDYYEKGYYYIIKKYFNYGFGGQLKVSIKRIIKNFLHKVYKD